MSSSSSQSSPSLQSSSPIEDLMSSDMSKISLESKGRFFTKKIYLLYTGIPCMN